MRSTLKLSISLPIEIAEAIKATVASGEYASASEVIRDGMRTLMTHDRAVETWLHSQVVPVSEKLKADRSCALSISQVRASLASTVKENTSGKSRKSKMRQHPQSSSHWRRLGSSYTKYVAQRIGPLRGAVLKALGDPR